jgi:uncharacterized protein YndB with AHSA1/START domain
VSAIRRTIVVDRSPDDVHAYATDPSHLPEWQLSAVSAQPLEDGPVHAGSRVRVTRRIGAREIPTTMEYTDYDPPRSWGLRGGS